ncbi:MAG TPA: FecR domain-containing protein [Polyangiaceae bacterium]|jgi:transmembrane sensor
MNDLSSRLAEAALHVTPRWTAGREQAALARLEHGRRARRVRLAAALGALAAVVAVLTVRFESVVFLDEKPGLAGRTIEAPAEGGGAAQRRLLALEDGSRVTTLSSVTRAKVVEETPNDVVIEMSDGQARFEVAPGERRFKVLASPVSVTVLGTVFEVFADARQVTVFVERGRVRVDHLRGTTELSIGQSASFERSASAPVTSAEPAKADSAPSVAQAARSKEAVASSLPRWRILAEQGSQREAYQELSREDGWARLSSAGDLLAAADVARARGDFQRASSLLRRVVNGYPSDARAGLAAFTLGKLLVDQLGAPREAARAFASVRTLEPGGPLAEDAMAREIEALVRGGAREEARSLARIYFRHYPNGRRRALVERYVPEASLHVPEVAPRQ